MGVFGKLFGSEKVINTAVDGVYNGLDKLMYTDEEKADMAVKKSELHMKFLKLYEPFKIAQRLLALIVGIPYMSLMFIVSIMYLVGLSLPPENIDGVMQINAYGTHLMNGAVNFMNTLNNAIGGYFGMIMGFYFAGGLIEGGIRAWNEPKKQ